MTTITRLAYKKTCDGCSAEIFMAICRDGRWRPFENYEVPAGTPGAWAWRKRQGMEETEMSRGHVIHYCADFHDRAFRIGTNFAADYRADEIAQPDEESA